MTEVSFARQFLSALDSRPIKLSSDHISDPRQLPSQVAYTIPKYPSAPQKRKRSALSDSPGSSASPQTLTIVLKHTKSADYSLTLPKQPLTSSIFDLKQSYAAKYSLPLDKIKLLYAKKPVADSKTLKDVLGDEGSGKGQAEFGVMVLGGAVPTLAAENAGDAKGVPAAVPPTKAQPAAALDEEFWSDLKGFLMQRLKNEGQAETLAGQFRKAAS